MGKRRNLRGVSLSTSRCVGSPSVSIGSNGKKKQAADIPFEDQETEDPNALDEPIQEIGDQYSSDSDAGSVLTLGEMKYLTDYAGPSKKRRGKTTMSEIWNLQPDKMIIVNFDGHGNPIGRGSSLLSDFLGTIARTGNLCPVSDVNWKLVPNHVKQEIVKIVKEKFDFQGCEMKKYILYIVGRCRKGYRSSLKTDFFDKMRKAETPIEDIFESVPIDVILDQWKALVDAWSRPQAEKESNMGKEIRKKVKFPHTAGSINFPTLASEFKEKNGGRDPSRIERFEYQHKRKDGSFVNEEAALIHEKAMKVVDEKLSAIDDVITPLTKVSVETRCSLRFLGQTDTEEYSDSDIG